MLHPLNQVWKSAWEFLRNNANKQTDWETNKQTNRHGLMGDDLLGGRNYCDKKNRAYERLRAMLMSNVESDTAVQPQNIYEGKDSSWLWPGTKKAF